MSSKAYVPKMTTQTQTAQSPSVLAGALKAFALIGAIVLVGMYLKTMFGGVAPTPAAFESHATLSQALDTAGDGSVLAYATADWCGPCQAFKRGALANERFTQWIDSNDVTTAYLDATGANEEAQHLGISSIPTLVYFKHGKEVARHTGVMSADRLIGWLEQANQL